MANHSTTVQALRGILIMGSGLLLLMYTLGFLQAALSMVLIGLALVAILYGFFSSGLYGVIKNKLFTHKK